jgi:SAM-dependent methyltransferase
MIYRRMPAALRVLPDALQRYVLHFESEIENALRAFAASLPAGARVLDAGAGEAQYAELFQQHRYIGVDLGIGDEAWAYDQLNAIAALEYLPFSDGSFDGCLNVVTLEHVRDPARVLGEIARVLRPGGRLLLITPLEWEEHQQPYDFYRYTRYGVEYLLTSSGLAIDKLSAVGGLFRLVARRLMNAGQMAPLLMPLVAIPALLLPLLDGIDRKRSFTFGHICLARKP